MAKQKPDRRSRGKKRRLARPTRRAAAKPTAVQSPARLLQLGFGFWGPRALLSAVELGVFSILAKGPLSEPELSEQVGLHPRAARDFLDTLVALQLLERKAGKYRNVPDADAFLDRAKPTYVGGLLEMAAKRLYPFWGSLTEALRTGNPQNEIKGGGDLLPRAVCGSGSPARFLVGDDRREYGVRREPSRENLHGRVTARSSMSAERKVVYRYRWRWPTRTLSGGEFDLSPVAPIYEDYVRSFGLDSRLKFCAGDFFRDPLPQADVLIMGHILHDWNLEQKHLLLQKAYAALPKRGVLIVYDAMIDDARSRNTLGLLMSLNMLIETPGGFDYTAADCRAWMKATGFRKTSVVPLTAAESMVIATK